MKKKTFAFIRVLAAVLIAVVLLAVSGFAFVDILTGATSVTDGSELTNGEYAQADLAYIMDICGVEKNAAGEATAYYVVAPIGNRFTVIRFPASDFETISSLQEATLAYLQGASSAMPYHMIISGTAKESSATIDRLLSQWFTDNSEWMSTAGVIAAVDDYDTYLCEYTLQADQVGSVSYTAAVVLSVLAALFVAYAIVELVLIGAGVYNKTPAKKVKKEKPEKTVKAAQTPAETAENDSNV